MDEGLFVKHLRSLKVRTDNKKEIISLIKEYSGIDIEDEEIILKGKKCSLRVSSVKRSSLVRSKIQENLSKKGYVVEF
jgi:hypothetical protein